MNWKCWLGLHDFPWPPHENPSWSMWNDFRVECARGCGARTIKRCNGVWGQHWEEKHPEPQR